MNGARLFDDVGYKAWQALVLWLCFFATVIIINNIIPLVLRVDLHTWTYSTAKLIVIGFVVYGALFIVFPLILTKGWKNVRKPFFMIQLLVAMVGTTLWGVMQPAASLVIAALIIMHWRFDLSCIGIRLRKRNTDAVAILLLGLLYFLPVLLHFDFASFSLLNGVLAGLSRLFANPASTAENLFYFGFLTERLSAKIGKWLTPPLIALMYTAHEMSNPEYWHEGMPFGFVFIGVAIITAVYLWRRSIVVIWLGDGLGRFLTGLILPTK